MTGPLSGAVLAGGKSSRFGRDKTLEMFHGKRFIDHAVDHLRAVCESVAVVANDLAPFLDVDADLLRDIIPGQGPLVGIYTALLHSPRPWLLVKAADMPFMEPRLVELLAASADDTVDVVVPMSGELFEPLLALYHRNCLPLIRAVLNRGGRKVSDLYRRARVRRIGESRWREVDPEGRSFLNVNTTEDWEKLHGPEPGP